MENPKTLQKAIDKFFKEKEKNVKSLTFWNLCVHLKITKEKFFELKNSWDTKISEILNFTIQRLEAKIEEWILSWDISNTAWMFIMKNLYWYVDKKEEEIKISYQKTLQEEKEEIIREHEFFNRVDKYLKTLWVI